jgi:hypothetical protein
MPWVVWAASIALHVALLAWILLAGNLPQLEAPAPTVRAAELPLAVGAVAAGGRGRVARSRAPAPVTVPRSLQVPAAQADADGASRPGRAGTAPVTTPAPNAVAGRIGPARASGKVWVQPLPLPPKELAARLAKTNAELADSAVTSIIQAFLDSIATDPATLAARPPDWTTTLAGSKFGLDSRWIYIGGLKIPTALLALLPIPAGGNDQRAFDRSAELYRDLRQAAQRSANVADFRKAIKEIRERKESEREFERNQRTPPPDLVPEDNPK